ncbi:hypothetical protein J6590_099565 [Homalodisca vitripennis]|nr:hypothetical protein J6590_099565 [Homalodisca vitripennis]
MDEIDGFETFLKENPQNAAMHCHSKLKLKSRLERMNPSDVPAQNPRAKTRHTQINKGVAMTRNRYRHFRRDEER